MKIPVTLRGKLIAMSETQSFPSGFRKRTFVVLNPDEKGDDRWNQPIQFELHKDACDKLDNFDLGDEVDVAADVQGNEHNSRFFVSLKAWKIVKIGADGARKPEPDREFSRPAEKPRQEPRERNKGREDAIDF